jgi:hypothetical protein
MGVTWYKQYIYVLVLWRQRGMPDSAWSLVNTSSGDVGTSVNTEC